MNHIRGDEQIHASSIYIDLNHPATCSGYISQLHFCYHVTDFSGFVGDDSIHEAIVQIWRDDPETQELHVIHEHKLGQNTTQHSDGEFICRNKTLEPQDYIFIYQNDTIGVNLPSHILSPPLQLISTNTLGSGLYSQPLSLGSPNRVQRTSLKFYNDRTMHLYAFIGKPHVHRHFSACVYKIYI